MNALRKFYRLTVRKLRVAMDSREVFHDLNIHSLYCTRLLIDCSILEVDDVGILKDDYVILKEG